MLTAARHGRVLGHEDRAKVQAQLDGLGTELVVERSLAYAGGYVLDTLWKWLKLDTALGALLHDRAYEIHVARRLIQRWSICPPGCGGSSSSWPTSEQSAWARG